MPLLVDGEKKSRLSLKNVTHGSKAEWESVRQWRIYENKEQPAMKEERVDYLFVNFVSESEYEI